ncbi:MAG TPA: amidohydrolase [Candidatus Acidoferrales bacterium]|nr:amidohydrolase [Candidatus Acidoferrales bacterium]
MSSTALRIASWYLLMSLCSNAQSFADLVLVNGKIWTVNPSQPVVEAAACLGSRIVATGSSAEIRKWIGANTKVIDLGGRLVVPGFNDSHVHLVDGGRHAGSVQLHEARSEAEFRDRIRDYAAKLPKGRWIVGGDWDQENWSPARLPNHELIDVAAGDHPVFVNRHDGHMVLVNNLVLRQAGITRDTPDPPGGTIVRDERGEPTGILKDAAQDAAAKLMPRLSSEEIENAVRAAMREARQNGVTSVQDVGTTPEYFRVYQKLLRNGELTLRISTHQPLAAWHRLADAGVGAAFGNPMLQAGALKAFADGSLGSTTALFYEPYSDAPNNRGIASQDMIPESKMKENILGADRAGLQVAIHAIGDRANDRVLSLFEEVAKENGPRDRRFRIEHAQHLRAVDIPRFASLGVIASMQPYHAIDDGSWAEKRIGHERAKGTYAFRSLLDAGAILAFGSDWYVAPLKPIEGIYAAATRRTLDGRHPEGWIPEQRISAAEAVRAYTWGSAYASFGEKYKGTIAPGMLADLAVLSDDILSIDPAQISSAKVMITVFDGRVIYQRNP